MRNLRRGYSAEAAKPPRPTNTSFIQAAARSATKAANTPARNTPKKSGEKADTPSASVALPSPCAAATAVTSPQRRSRSSTLQSSPRSFSNSSSPSFSDRQSLASSRRSSTHSGLSVSALTAATHALHQPIQESLPELPKPPVFPDLLPKAANVPSPSKQRQLDHAAQPTQQPPRVVVDSARAAAKATSAKEKQYIAPRVPMSAKFVSSLSAALKREEDQNHKPVQPAPSALQGIDQGLFYERMMDRLAEDKMSIPSPMSPSQSSKSNENPRAALQAAMGARARAESHVANIQNEIRSSNKRKKSYKPLVQWSSQRPQSRYRPTPDNMSVRSLGSQESQSDFAKAYMAALNIPAAPAKGIISWLSKQSPGSDKSLSANQPFLPPVSQLYNQPPQQQTREATPVKQQPMLQTLRKKHKGKFNEDKPWKHHQRHITGLTEKERKRYDRLWAANCGTYLPYIPVSEEESGLWYEAVSPFIKSGSPQPSTDTRDTAQGSSNEAPHEVAHDNVSLSGSVLAVMKSRSKDVHGIVVRQIWQRSCLPYDTLAAIWDLVDTNMDGTLDRSSFIAGMWLVDQCLYGRKLPSKLPDEVWQSIDGLSDVKIRFDHGKRVFPRLRFVRNTKKAGKGSYKIMKNVVRKAAHNKT